MFGISLILCQLLARLLPVSYKLSDTIHQDLKLGFWILSSAYPLSSFLQVDMKTKSRVNRFAQFNRKETP